MEQNPTYQTALHNTSKNNSQVLTFSFKHSHSALTKQRHYAALNLQLERLQNNMAKLERHAKTTADQLKMIESFGVAQGSLLVVLYQLSCFLGLTESSFLFNPNKVHGCQSCSRSRNST